MVEETRQNFASTSVTQPTALPLVPVSRSSSQHQSNNLGASQSANITGRSTRLPRRHLPANQIFAELNNPDAPLSPASQDKSMSSFSYIDVPESSCPVLPTLSVLAKTLHDGNLLFRVLVVQSKRVPFTSRDLTGSLSWLSISSIPIIAAVASTV